MNLAIELPCSPAKWQGIRRAAEARGVHIEEHATDGEIEHKGVTVKFAWDGASLEAEVIKMPWRYKLIPNSVIIAKVKELFDQI